MCVLSGTHILALKMCRTLLWGSVLNHGAVTTSHFLIRSASYLIGENLEIVSVVQYHYMQICTPFLPNHNFKHTPYANHHRNTVQLVFPQAHCNQFKTSSFYRQLRDGILSTLIKMAWTLYIISNTHYTALLLFFVCCPHVLQFSYILSFLVCCCPQLQDSY